MLHRPRHVAAALVAASTLLVTACSSGDDPTTEGSGSSSGTAADAGAFPVTIEHAYGETTVEGPSDRIVTVGFNEQDFLLALGITPVGTREFFGYDYQNRPWAQEQLAGAEIPTVGGTELDVEQVLALDPDLILGPYSFLEQEQYDQLAAYAPTVGDLLAAEGVQSASWQEELTAIGQAVGLPDEAAQMVTDVEGEFAAAAEEHPAFEGRTLTLLFSFDGELSVVDAQDLRMRFFTDLGFVAPETSGPVSPENLAMIDTDALVVLGATRETMLADPLFASLGVVAEDRTVFAGEFTGDFAGALGFGSPLSLPYALGEIVPQLDAATDDDPATVVEDL